MPETPDDPLLPGAGSDPFDAPLSFVPPTVTDEDPLRPAAPSGGADALPFVPEPSEDAGPSAPHPASWVPESVRQRAAEDLPFALAPGGFGATPFGGEHDPRSDDHEGIPTGLPDLRALAGIEVPEAPTSPVSATPMPSASAPPAADLPEALDGDLMALPSPSMIEPSPFSEAGADGLDDGSAPDEVTVGHAPSPPRGLHEDDTEMEQLPPTPIGMVRRDATDVVPASVMMNALAESERRHVVHLAIAFCLGAGSAVVGFVGARWALVHYG